MTLASSLSRRPAARYSVLTVCFILAVWSAVCFFGVWLMPKDTNWTYTHQLVWTLCADFAIGFIFLLSVIGIRFCVRCGKGKTQ